jgi:hypothetical protein
MKRKTLAVVVSAAALPLIAASVQAASAHPAPGPYKTATPAKPAAHQVLSDKDAEASPLVVNGYKVVSSALLTDTANTQTAGSAVCPGTSHLIGGGAVISGTSLTENLNGSLPLTDGKTWRAYVNNAGSTNGTFRVYAICARKVTKYANVLSSGTANPAGTQASATVNCPTATVPLGGGGDSGSSSTAANMNTSVPLTRGWRVDMNNASSTDTTAYAAVICAKKPTSYQQVVGTSVTVNPGVQASSSATCPSGTVVFGGGAFNSSGSTAADLNSSLPSGNGWTAYENNNSSSANSFTAYAVCGALGA